MSNKYALLTKCEVKMAGHWQSSFFACLWTETKSRSINSQKRTRPISSHLDRTNLVNKGFITWFSRKFFLRDIASSPKRARWLNLACSGSQSQRMINYHGCILSSGCLLVTSRWCCRNPHMISQPNQLTQKVTKTFISQWSQTLTYTLSPHKCCTAHLQNNEGF